MGGNGTFSEGLLALSQEVGVAEGAWLWEELRVFVGPICTPPKCVPDVRVSASNAQFLPKSSLFSARHRHSKPAFAGRGSLTGMVVAMLLFRENICPLRFHCDFGNLGQIFWKRITTSFPEYRKSREAVFPCLSQDPLLWPSLLNLCNLLLTTPHP